MFDKQMFAKRLKELREEKGLNQRELAANIDVSNGSISYYEKCQRLPDIETAYKLSEFFGVSSDYLLGLSEEKPKDEKLQAVCKYTGLNADVIKNMRKQIQFLNDNLNAENKTDINEFEFTIDDGVGESKTISQSEYRKSHAKDYFKFINALLLKVERFNLVEWATYYCRFMYKYENDNRYSNNCELAEFRFIKGCSGMLYDMYDRGVFHDEEEDENADD